MFFNATVRTETRRSANLGVAHVPGLPNLGKVSRFSRMSTCVIIIHNLSWCIITYHQCIILYHPFIFIHDVHSFIISIFTPQNVEEILHEIFTPHPGVRSTSQGRPATKVVPWKSYERTCRGHKATMAAGCGLLGGGKWLVFFWFKILGDDDFGVKCSWMIFLKFKRSHS